MKQEKECLKCGEDFDAWDDEKYCEKCEAEETQEEMELIKIET